MSTLLSTRFDESLRTTFTTNDALAAGMHPRDLYRLRDEGTILELSRGVFRRADAPAAAWPDLLAIQLRSPISVVCCLTAAMAHELTDEMPAHIQIAVPRNHRPPTIHYPPTKVMKFNASTFELGVTTLQAAPGEYIRIYNPSRTVVDLMRLRHRLGEAAAFGALRRYLNRRDAEPGQLLRLAEELNVLGLVRRAVDVILAA